MPGRAATLRPHTRKELAATAVLAVPLHEASLKVRDRGRGDEPEDVEAGIWAGVLPLRMVAGDLGGAGPGSRPGRCPATYARRADRAARLALSRVRAHVSAPWSCSSPTPSAVDWSGEVLGRFEAKGLSIVAMEHRTIDAAQSPTSTTPSTSRRTSTRRCATS